MSFDSYLCRISAHRIILIKYEIEYGFVLRYDCEIIKKLYISKESVGHEEKVV